MIIGGGLAGLISSIQLVRAGIPCTVIEKKSYPLHRVCGEYVSNEALPFLKSSGLYPEHLELPKINFFQLSSVKGRTSRLRLDLGGFGISRYSFDNHLYVIAKKEGVKFQLNAEVVGVSFSGEGFEMKMPFGTLSADLVIGAFGKRSKIDVQQNRSFIRKRSPYVAVKYHVRSDHPQDLVSLHNFPGGYCGVCSIEDGLTNLCYLTHRDNLKSSGNIQEMENDVLFRNPLLKQLFANCSFVFEKPEVINEVSFETKGPVENHILMAGDAAGMITPLCGNGMAIAMRSGKIVSSLVRDFVHGKIDRATLEHLYCREWNNAFRQRLWFGRKLQRLFGSTHFSELAVTLTRSSRTIGDLIVRNTHGKYF